MFHKNFNKDRNNFWSLFHQKNKNQIPTLMELDDKGAIDKSSSFLDIGFGNGENLLLLKERGYHNLYGVEKDCEVIQRSDYLKKELNIDIFHISETDRFLCGSIDCVILFGVLSTITQIVERSHLIRLINRVLSSSGTVFVYDYMYDPKRDASDYRQHFDQELNYDLNIIHPSWSLIPFVHYTLPQWVDIFSEYTLSEIKVTTIPSFTRFDNQGLFLRMTK